MNTILRKKYYIISAIFISAIIIVSVLFYSGLNKINNAYAENGVTVYETTSPATELNVDTASVSNVSTNSEFDEFVFFTEPTYVDTDGTYRVVFDKTNNYSGYLYVSYETPIGTRARLKYNLNIPSFDIEQSSLEGIDKGIDICDIKISENLGAIFITYILGNYSYIEAYSLSNMQKVALYTSDINVYIYGIDFIGDTIYCYGRGLILSVKFDKNSFTFDESNYYISNINNKGNDIVIGNIASILYGNTIKLFIVYNGNVYESTNNTLSSTPIENLGNVKNISISKDYFLTYTTNEINIYNYAFVNSSIRLTSPTEPDIYSLYISNDENYDEFNLKSISCFSIDYETNLIYVADSAYNAVKVYTPTNLSYLGMLGSYGTAEYRFRNPTSVTVSKNYIFVADNENGRIQRISRTDYKNISSISSSPNKPLLVAANKYDQLYVYDSSKTLTKYGYDLQKINGGTVNLSDYEVTQIAVGPDNALYFYDSVSQKIYRIKDNYTTVEEFCPLPAAITKISFALAGSTLYAANAKTIYPIDNNGNIISERTINIQNYSFVKLTGLAVDYEGNILISGEKNGSVINLYKIAREGKNIYSTAKKYSFKSNYFTLNYINGLVCDTSANLCYLVSGASTELDSANSVLFLNGLISTGNKTYDDFPETFDNITAAKVITETEFMAHLSNFEDVKTINEGTYVVVLANKVYGSTEYCYVCSFDSNGNSFGFIKKSHLEYKQGSAVTDSYKTVIPLTGDTITIFKTPIETQNIGTFDNILYSDIDISIEVIDDVCNEEGTQIVLGGAKWYKVIYNGKTGYVTKYSILPFVQDDAVPIKSFAKVKADAIGLTVTLYAQPDEYSAILNFLTDGKKVQLCEQFDKNSKFTKIIADGTVGYVLTDNLILDGLTTGQIVAIIVTVVVAVIAIIILVITLVIKKKRKDNFL